MPENNTKTTEEKVTAVKTDAKGFFVRHKKKLIVAALVLVSVAAGYYGADYLNGSSTDNTAGNTQPDAGTETSEA